MYTLVIPIVNYECNVYKIFILPLKMYFDQIYSI